MILIADSGSTKTEWVAVSNDGVACSIKTSGINPVYQTTDEILADIKENVLPTFASLAITEVFFYGAGCLPEKVDGVVGAIAHCFPNASISVQTDLVGAAVALCGDTPGIACILGTGSNSCFWDGKFIAKNVSPLGFILGDEGSGAVLGKLLVADILKNQLSEIVTKKFFNEFGFTASDIINKVYRQPFPNRFLASLTRFMGENREEVEIRNIIVANFVLFIKRNVMQYDYQRYPVNFIGSIAFYFKDMLEEAAAITGITVGTIIQSPIDGLVKFHSKNR